MGVVRKVIRGTAEIVFTIGLVGLLLCVHQLWWTNIEGRAAAQESLEELYESWEQEPTADEPAPEASPIAGIPEDEGPQDVGTDGQKDGTAAAPGGAIRGEAFAALYIPRLGSGYKKPIVEGTSAQSLRKGVGHYTYAPYTAPGQVGNFGIAAHRNGNGEPFRHLNKLVAGDFVVVQTKTEWYTYQIVRGPFITKPDNGEVLASNPPMLGLPGGQRLITLTTCDPEFTSKNRMIYWGTLVATDVSRPGFVPAALKK
ncbi:class E sortase [Yinghuangia soli]|uniref:Class E sortase n=1 Tax=Yinghuangia soli TaxID=2908204 RepID=A0AA41U0H1_9ACTN|nr:class E sortase [Yinghuangia soli]MCF2526412.1 class E sortase [Yinghuangia soli]